MFTTRRNTDSGHALLPFMDTQVCLTGQGGPLPAMLDNTFGSQYSLSTRYTEEIDPVVEV